MNTDVFGWMIITGVFLAYARMRAVPKPVTLSKRPNEEDQPDVTRWRHDGQQDFVYRDGNRQPVEDEFMRSFH